MIALSATISTEKISNYRKCVDPFITESCINLMIRIDEPNMKQGQLYMIGLENVCQIMISKTAKKIMLTKMKINGVQVG